MLESRRFALKLAAIFLGSSAVLIGAGWLYLAHQQGAARAAAQEQLSAIADLKLRQISNWREERLSDARLFARARFVAQDVKRLLDEPDSEAARAAVFQWLNLLKNEERYDAAMVFDTRFDCRLAIPPSASVSAASVRSSLDKALQSHDVAFSDLQRDATDALVHLDIVFPVFEEAEVTRGAPIAVVLLKVDAPRFLFPLIQSWPTPSQTAETLLVRREDNDVVYLNDLRHRPGTALSLRMPLGSADLPSAKVLRGETRAIEGRDYRGVLVVAVGRRIPGTAWAMVAKVDRAEIYAPLRRQMGAAVAVLGSLLVASGLLVGLLWHQRNAQFLQREMALESERAALAQRLAHLMRDANDIILVLDPQGRVLEANDRALEGYRYSQAEIQQKTLRELQASETLAGLDADLGRVKREGAACFESLHQRKGGETFPVEVSARQISVDGGTFILSVVRDITERKRAQVALEELGRKNGEALRVAHMGHWEFDVQSGQFTFNDQYYTLHGTTAAQAGGYQMSAEQFARKYVHPQDAHLVEESIRKAVASEDPGFQFETEARILRADGEVRTVFCWFRSEKDARGATVKLYGVNQDITERKRAEEALRASSQQITAILSSISDAFFSMDEQLVVTYFNPAAERLLKRPREQVVGRYLFDAFPEAKGSVFETVYTQALREKTALAFETFFERDPYRNWYGVRVYPQANGISVYFQVITERKRAEEALQRSEALLRESQAIAHLGSWELDLTSKHLTWSDEVYRIFGLQPQEFGATYEAFLESVHPEDRAAVEAAYSGSVQEGKDTYEIEHRVVKKNTGELRTVHEKCLHIKDGAGKIVRSIGMVHDITERKRAEAELQRHREHLEELVAERTAALKAANRELEAFSYSVSHDLRAPLRAIEGYAQILLRSFAPSLPEMGQKMLEAISRQAGLMGQLIEDLLGFSRLGRQAMRRVPIDMDALTREVVAEQSASNPKRTAQIKIHPLPRAFGDRAMMRVVLTNLLSNAIKYSRRRNPPLIEIGGSVQGGQDVYFVKDNGAGFDMKDADKLFGVFQRLHSKEEFEGTGVGLALVQRILQRHGGRVWAEGKVDEGATFFFSLPAQKPTPDVKTGE